MFYPLMNIMWQYGAAVLVGILVGLISKAYFSHKVQKKIRNYQSEIIKNHARILELEAVNDQLNKHVKEVEQSFARSSMVMN